ncbi:MAG: hypothetical protein BWY72_02549 [Bacteroidetes bacterium ADurb.Bin416]|nr:MAG: hypothetical protein BWY72_02549 [Bacteroidetes bacterium ADurb.Bin416]
MASRSALTPSFDTQPCIQYQMVQGLAFRPGLLNASRTGNEGGISDTAGRASKQKAISSRKVLFMVSTR